MRVPSLRYSPEYKYITRHVIRHVARHVIDEGSGTMNDINGHR